MKLFVTRPNYDWGTSCISQWFNSILADCNKKGINYLDLNGKKANKKEVGARLRKYKSKFVVFNGHGDNETIYGQKDEILVNKDNMGLLKNKIVYALACNAAAKLGKECVENGTTAFIGYTAKFAIMFNPNMSMRPLEDRLVKPVMESSNEIVKTLLKGKTVSEAYDRSQNRFNKEIENLQKYGAPIDAQNLLPVLLWNKISQKVHGNGNSTISDNY